MSDDPSIGQGYTMKDAHIGPEEVEYDGITYKFAWQIL
jgi:hypothetical protein